MGPHLKICSYKLPVNIFPHKNVLNMIHPEDVFEEYIDHICTYTDIHIPIGFLFLLQAMRRWWALAILFWHVSGEAAAGIKPVGPSRPQLFSPEPGSSSCRAFGAGVAACYNGRVTVNLDINLDHESAAAKFGSVRAFPEADPPQKKNTRPKFPKHCILFHLRPEPSTFLAAAADTREAEAMVKGHTRPRPDHTIHTCTQLHR